MSTYEYSGINESVTISLLAGEKLEEPYGVALKLTEDGAVLPAAGDDVVGIALISNQGPVAAGGRVDVQVKDIGFWKAGAGFTQGDLLATDAGGLAQKAADGQYVVARALTGASAKGDLAKVQIINAGKLTQEKITQGGENDE